MRGLKGRDGGDKREKIEKREGGGKCKFPLKMLKQTKVVFVSLQLVELLEKSVRKE